MWVDQNGLFHVRGHQRRCGGQDYNCAAGVLPNKRPPSTCASCRIGCFFDFINPVPNIAIEKGAGAAGRGFSVIVGDLAGAVAKS